MAAAEGLGVGRRRLRVGRWALSQEKADDTGQAHVLAEFYAPGAGWVAADCASGVLHDKTPGRLQYFGHFQADFITLHVGTEMVLDTAHFGKQTVGWLQGVAYWVIGGGELTGLNEKQEWRVRAIP